MKEEWNYKILNEMGTISRGKSKHRPRNDPALFNGKYPFIQTADVKNANLYITEYSQTYNDKGLAQSKLWQPGTLCITIAANIADTGILGIPACFPDSVMGFIPDEKISDVKFVKYCFDILQKECQSIAEGTAQDNLSWEKLSRIKFPCPPLPTQQKIASILSAYDDLIENNRKQIKLLEEAAQKLYKEWFVKLNFPGHENTKIVDGVPEGWKKDSILSFSDILKQINPAVQKFEGEKTYYATADVTGTILDGIGEKVTFSNRPSRASVQPCKKSVWFARMSNSYKILCCYGASEKLAEKSIISSGFAGFHSEEKYFGFIYTFIASDYFNQEKDRYATGATQVSLTNEGLRRIALLVPSEDLIIKFSSVTNSMIKKMEMLKEQIKQLQSARDKLLPKLMNGEYDV